MIPVRIYHGRDKIIRAYKGSTLIFRSEAPLRSSTEMAFVSDADPLIVNAKAVQAAREIKAERLAGVVKVSVQGPQAARSIRGQAQAGLVARKLAPLAYAVEVQPERVTGLEAVAAQAADSEKLVQPGVTVGPVSAGPEPLGVDRMAKAETAVGPVGAAPRAAGIGLVVKAGAGAVVSTAGTTEAQAARVATVGHAAEMVTWDPTADDTIKEVEAAFSLDGFTENYTSTKITLEKPIEVGKTYTVVWDGTKYLCKAKSIHWTKASDTGNTEHMRVDRALGSSGVITQLLDTPLVPDVDPTGEPFLLASSGDNTTNCVAYTQDTSEKHTVRVYDASDPLPEQQLTFEKSHNWYTKSYGVSAELNSVLMEGAEYKVSWDGVLYTCTARTVKYDNKYGVYTGIALGDTKQIPEMLFEETNVREDSVGGNGEPFYIHTKSGGTAVGIETLDESANHIVRIYVE